MVLVAGLVVAGEVPTAGDAGDATGASGTAHPAPGVVQAHAAPVSGEPEQHRAPRSPTQIGWLWPLTPRPPVVRGFEPPARRWLAGHRGADLAAQPGQGVLAPADGVVAFVGQVAGRPVVSLRHDGGLRSTYEPVTGIRKPGSTVRAGELIGYLADQPGHCAPAACLHWGAVLDSDHAYVDPVALIGAQPIVLLPLG